MNNEKKSPALHPADGTIRREDDLIARSDRDAVHTALADILSGHLRIGMLFSQIMEKAIGRYTAEHGDTKENRQHIKDAIYSFIEKEYGRTRTAVRLYIRCYQNFGSSVDNANLTFRDMALGLGNSKAAGTA